MQFLPAPTHLVYLAAIAVFALQGVGVLLMRETVTRPAGRVRSLVPEIALPPSSRRAVLAAAPVLFAVWALAGFYAALGPAILRVVTGSSDPGHRRTGALRPGRRGSAVGLRCSARPTRTP